MEFVVVLNVFLFFSNALWICGDLGNCAVCEQKAVIARSPVDKWIGSGEFQHCIDITQGQQEGMPET